MVADVKGSSATLRVAGTRFTEVRWVATTGSTNADLLAAAAQGEPHGLVLVADHQDAGRGRLDRTWEAPPGASLLVSVLLRPALAPEELFLLATATGVAAVEACRQVAGLTPGLKWPNDLVVVADDRLAGRKLGGILAEAHTAPHRGEPTGVGRGPTIDAVVVGMGLNVNWPVDLPPELDGIAAALSHVVGHDVDREDLLVAWLQRLDHWLALVERRGPVRSDGRAELLEQARHLSATLGRPVRVELPGGRRVEGDAVALTDAGHLVVAPDDGGAVVEVTVGDIVHLRHR